MGTAFWQSAALSAIWDTESIAVAPTPPTCKHSRNSMPGIAAGKVTRKDLADFVSAYDAPGITKQIKFDATGEPVGSAVYYSVVEGGKIVAKGLIK